ncbi:hypothetical protein HanXRQr2_Chr02g0072901 [Helianthus annuus]|uniref:Uncharacterized protein n=1 Tax=Helianthus annuus TaxID=4232 RepID=A0A9K3NZG1_HELAN|nr:hypothetical protein HanXRQr2_Chr02g0072901 [Helianthus annuus]
MGFSLRSATGIREHKIRWIATFHLFLPPFFILTTIPSGFDTFEDTNHSYMLPWTLVHSSCSPFAINNPLELHILHSKHTLLFKVLCESLILHLEASPSVWFSGIAI